MKKSSLILAVLALVMQGVVSNNVWADGDDPISFEKKGTFTITKGMVVEKGAKLKIINSTANY